MSFEFSQVNWLSVFVCFVVGQVFLTLWFTVMFGEPWAKAYSPSMTKAEHTKEVPGFTYGIGALCVILLVLGLELLQLNLGVSSLSSGLSLGIFIAIFMVLSTMIPGYIFLKRYNALILAAGSQFVAICIISSVLGAW